MSIAPMTADATPRETQVIAAIRAGDSDAFTQAAERYRRELHVHCYRMLGSFDDAEDLVQDTLLRAWNRRETYEGRASFRAWLYRIATNACLDFLASRRRRAPVASAGASPAAPPEIPWLQPYPDRLLEEVAADDETAPDSRLVARDTMELAYLVAIQLLPPRQRAALLVRDVLGWTANETAGLLDSSVASANSAVQRARARLKKELPARPIEWAASLEVTAAERELLDRYVAATEHPNPEAFADLLREDARCIMPPEPTVVGARAMVEAWIAGGFGDPSFGELRCRITRANRQPAVASYVKQPGDTRYRPMALDVLRIEDGRIAEIRVFGPRLFAQLGLPETL